ncbi:hypothetical protein AAGW05_12700 [Arthrobacter sp. LAPM80]|uniref:aggregation-promoting factor C-terminal-like domain-containing protein n=1 Tax=Arthrobacter sp. LAPM80 TaxID=3141788 RepID=UPI00398B7782
MSNAPQRGRRRAEPVRRPSIFGLASARPGSHAAGIAGASSTVSATAKCMAAVAVVGALVGAGAVAQQVGASGDPSMTSLVSSVGNDSAASAVTAPANAAISFPGLSVSSNPSPTNAPVKVQSNDVKPETAPKPSAAPAPAPVAVDDPAGAQAYASSQLASFGWGADQMSCLTRLWERESSWLTSAENASSGAYGIAQSLPANKMDSTGSDWATNYKTQIRWGLSYIEGRYGSPCGAWGHSESVGWY